MNHQEIEDLRAKVPCAALLEHQGWFVDAAESTARAVKYRRGAGEIIIVIHGGRGWFDPLSDAKGDVFTLARRLFEIGFREAADAVARLDGYVPKEPHWEPPVRRTPSLSVAERWLRRRVPSPRSASWRYLSLERAIPAEVLRSAVAQNLLRSGPGASMWAAHTDATGAISGWEERGQDWRGFATDGLKLLFRFGDGEAARLCVTEAAIDAMSLAAFEAMRSDTLYLSTGGGWSPGTDAALRTLAERDCTTLVAATDNDGQGDVYAERLEVVAQTAGCRFERLRPARQDWNRDLKASSSGQSYEENAKDLPHGRASPQGKLRPLRGP